MRTGPPDYKQVLLSVIQEPRGRNVRAKPGADRGEHDPSQETGKLNAALKLKRMFSSSKNII